ncbi:MAG: tRNA lysidine(34) synthetase TilS [Oscillospiraceae bacterium]|nr:tRNA lysidine(34) synthetase TilS [Oscillospiraceae bacterium]
MKAMLSTVSETIRKYNMLSPGERVLVALSGGADSVSLLVALKELGYQVFAVHVNHHLRGEESDRDEAFCKSLCERLGVDLFVEHVDVVSYCEKTGKSVEESARILRYVALNKHACGCKIATAHNLDDCFETTLFNLVRGCGIGGLTGIPPVRDNIVRPLIGTRRAEILEFLKSRNESYVTDSTNLEDDCSRNIIRLNVIPELERINPSLLKTYKSSLENFENAESYIDKEAERLLGISENGFPEGCDDFILATALSKILRKNGIEPSKPKIDELKELVRTGGKVNLKKGVYAVSKDRKLKIIGEPEPVPEPMQLSDTGDFIWGTMLIEFTEISQFDISTYNKRSLKWLMDKDRLCGSLVVRAYSGSEKIKLMGNGFSSTVKKLLAGVPAEKRKLIPIISDDQGAVFVKGYGVSERVSCTDKTTVALKINVREKFDKRDE